MSGTGVVKDYGEVGPGSSVALNTTNGSSIPDHPLIVEITPATPTSASDLIDNRSVSPINVSPNPASDFVTINFTNSLNKELSHVKIVDLAGRNVYESSGTATSMKISTLEFLKGVYLICIRKGDEMYNSKLIIE